MVTHVVGGVERQLGEVAVEATEGLLGVAEEELVILHRVLRLVTQEQVRINLSRRIRRLVDFVAIPRILLAIARKI